MIPTRALSRQFILGLVLFTQSVYAHARAPSYPDYYFTCRLYIWDGISALKYHLCRKLIQDNIYEGRGGVKFVRIRPGSLLDTLYPLSQHKPNGCVLCGHTFQDHLVRWWSPLLNTPFDQHLDRIREKSEAVMYNSTHGIKRHRYRYHDAYVDSRTRYDSSRIDPSSSIDGGNQKNRNKVDLDVIQATQRDTFHHHRHSNKGEIRQVGDDVTYTIPTVDFQSFHIWKRTLLSIVRAIAVEEMDMLIFLEGRRTAR